jgi:hypothetical protein
MAQDPTIWCRANIRWSRSSIGPITEGKIPGDPYLLVRRHPADPPGGVGRAVALRHGRVVDPWTAGSNPSRTWPTEAELVGQMSSLAQSAIHVTICSSIALDGAMFDRPQVALTFIPGAPRKVARSVAMLFRQELWQPIRRSGGVTSADDESSLIAAIADGLTHPERGREQRERLVEDVLTYTDLHSSARLAAEVEPFLQPGPDRRRS